LIFQFFFYYGDTPTGSVTLLLGIHVSAPASHTPRDVCCIYTEGPNVIK